MAGERTTQSTAPGERGCPLTSGGPIKMTRAGFGRCCAARVELAKEADDFDRTKKQDSRVQVSFKNPCLVCQGPPALLTFIEVSTNNGEDMATKRCIGECMVCGEKKNVARQQSGNICPTCENMRTYVKKRPHAALAMLRKMAPDVMGEKDAVKSPVSFGDAAALCSILRAGVDEDLMKVAERRMAVFAKLEETYLDQSKAFSDAEADRDDLKRQVAELQAELSSARKAAQAAQVEVTGGHNLHQGHVPQLKDLALRIAYGLLDGKGVDVSVKDVELLMTA